VARCHLCASGHLRLHVCLHALLRRKAPSPLRGGRWSATSLNACLPPAFRGDVLSLILLRRSALKGGYCTLQHIPAFLFVAWDNARTRGAFGRRPSRRSSWTPRYVPCLLPLPRRRCHHRHYSVEVTGKRRLTFLVQVRFLFVSRGRAQTACRLPLCWKNAILPYYQPFGKRQRKQTRRQRLTATLFWLPLQNGIVRHPGLKCLYSLYKDPACLYIVECFPYLPGRDAFVLHRACPLRFLIYAPYVPKDIWHRLCRAANG